MKTKVLLLSVLFAVVTGFAACGGGDDDPAPEPSKSKACDITSFKVGNDTWQVSGTNISFQYPKGTPQGDLTPTIVTSDKANVDPKSGVAQNFFTTEGVKYTVTAEDGTTTKTYTAKATVATTAGQ